MPKRKTPVLTIEGIIQHLKERRNIEKELEEYEKYNRLISENANDLISIFDYNFEYEYINETIYKKLLGYHKEDLIGKSLLNFVHAKDKSKTEQLLKDFKHNNSNGASIELRIRNSQGEYLWIESKGNLVIEEDGQKKILLISRDISERKIAEEKLIESEEKYKNLVEYSPNSIALLDLNGEIIDCNKVTEKIFNTPKKDMVGKNVSFLISNSGRVPPERVDSIVNNFLKKVYNNKMIEPMEFEHINNKNEKLWLKHAFSVVKIGGKDYIQVVTEDITDLKQAEIIIQDENKRLKKLDDLRGNFINRASHELKTPVTSIYGASQMVSEMYDELFSKYDFLFSPRYKEFLDLIRYGSRRLKDLTEVLLHLYQLDSGILILNKKIFNISKLILECISMLNIQAEQRNIKLTHKIPENIEMLIDEAQIFRVFQNFIHNAIKYTPPYGEIFVSIKTKNVSVIISVRDTGIGLSPNELKKIFTKYGKIVKNRSDIINEGLGFGLYFSKKLVKLHNGKIWAESMGIDKGSTFYIELPLYAE